MKDNILDGVREYYSQKIISHGTTSQGVDWNSKESQYLRFRQLCKVIDKQQDYSILDYGCGYGELINFLTEEANTFTRYIGFDISDEMVAKAEGLFGKTNRNISFTNALSDDVHDYVVASGIFNVKLNLADGSDWLEYILQTLKTINQRTSKGFAFNALTKYSDKEYMKDYLYYADPLELFDFCKREFSRNVALLHDYDLYEFTIIVRK
ncbi:MAG TPA: class I SAM-dependent methyltransferase [Flavipsychrobacter sp.]|nr:class I SAM-dependent methyltransferase [Flavipsychrobacter sp.]